MVRIYVKPRNGNEALYLRNAIMKYFRDPDLFIGFLWNEDKYRNEKENRVQIRVSGTVETMLWCIVEKAKFHITGLSTAMVVNALVDRYIYLQRSEVKK